MHASVHLRGTSPLGLCAFVYVCTMRAQKGLVRCEPRKALYSVVILAHQGFVLSVYLLVRERVHLSEPEHLYGVGPQGLCTSVYVCTVRAHKGFIQCAGARPPGLCTKCLCARAGACADELIYKNLYICMV